MSCASCYSPKLSPALLAMPRTETCDIPTKMVTCNSISDLFSTDGALADTGYRANDDLQQQLISSQLVAEAFLTHSFDWNQNFPPLQLC